MGKNNQQRRAEKRRRQQHSPNRSTPPPRGEQPDDRDFAEQLTVTAATTDDPAVRETVLRWLTEGPPRSGGVQLVDEVIQGRFEWALSLILQKGWEPHDLTRAAERRLSVPAAKAVARAVSGDNVIAGGDERHDAIDHAMTALSFLLGLPPLPTIGSGQPSTRRSEAKGDDRMLERVRALLAKAESTTFPEEAEALTAKAQELMARHAIDAAMLGSSDGSASGVDSRRVWVDAPYESEKVRLLAAVAAVNRARTVWIKDIGVVIVIGYAADLDIIELLFTSLLVQATRAMTTAPRRDDGRTRSFRRSFLIGYGDRIGERLLAATESATREATEEHGDRLLPVLADRVSVVDEVAEAAFPRLKSLGTRVSHHSGYVAGRAAAELATLDAGPGLGPRRQQSG